MNLEFASCIVLALLLASVLSGRLLRTRLPDHHVTAESRDAIKMAIGLVATMSALVLGLLLSSTKGSFDAERGEVVQLISQIEFLDRVLEAYGPGAAEARAELLTQVQLLKQRLWSSQPSTTCGSYRSNGLYLAIHHLAPQTPVQEDLKTRALSEAAQMGQQIATLHAQSSSSISWPLLGVVVFWLSVMLLTFSVLAPGNFSTNVVLAACALSVTGAIFLILELDKPFSGLLQIPPASFDTLLAAMEKNRP